MEEMIGISIGSQLTKFSAREALPQKENEIYDYNDFKIKLDLNDILDRVLPTTLQIKENNILIGQTTQLGHKKYYLSTFENLLRLIDLNDKEKEYFITLENYDEYYNCFKFTINGQEQIFEGKHSLILYTQTSDFTELGREKILEITASGIVKPIFKTRRLNSAEFFDIYKNNPGKENWLDRFFLIPPKETTGTDNIYSSCTTESKEILVRPLVVDKFLEFWRKEGTGYVYSFSNPDLRVFLASICSKLGIEVLSVDAREI